MWTLNKQIGSGLQSRVYSLGSPHGKHWVAKIVKHSNPEVSFYSFFQTHLNASEQPRFCTMKTMQPFSSTETLLILSRCQGTGDKDLRRWPPGDLSQCLHQIMIALNILHKYGILHNDVHFDNIMKRGSRFILIDFGLASYMKTSSQTITDQVYHRVKEDHFMFLYHAFRKLHPRVRGSISDYRSLRKRWALFFSHEKHTWRVFRKRFLELFGTGDTVHVQRFLNKILHPKQPLLSLKAPKTEQVLTKCLLARFYVLYMLFFHTPQKYVEILEPFLKSCIPSENKTPLPV